MAFRIKHWDRTYENSDSKRIKRTAWVPVPNDHEGMGFIELMSTGDGVTHFGVWNLIVQLASRCPERGLLVSDSNRVLSARDMALKTRGSVRAFEAAIPVLVKIGWLEEIDAKIDDLNERHPSTIGGHSGTPERQPVTPEKKPLEGKGREQKGMEGEGMRKRTDPDGSHPPTKKQKISLYQIRSMGGIMTKDTQAEWQDIIDQFEPEQIAEALQACDGKKWPGKIREILTTAKPKKTLPPTNEDQFSMDQQAAMELIKKFPIKKRRQLEEPQRFALHDVELALKDESPPLLRTALDKWNKANQALANAMAS